MNEKIETWADAFGTWHASVPLAPLDLIMSDPDAAEDQQASMARDAIIAELALRGAAPSSVTFARAVMTVERERVTSHGTAIYREVWPSDVLDMIIETGELPA
jgi:hypothetical protein